MKIRIKVTEAQLKETEGEAFKYLDSTDDTKPYNGQSTITAQGKLNGEEDGEPIFADRISKQRAPQSWSRNRMYGNINFQPHISEGVNINDTNNNNIPDHYENVGDMGGLDTLSDGNVENNLTVIPKGVETKLNILNQAMVQLNPKQKAMVINNMLEQNDFAQLPHTWKKELMYKLLSNKDKTT